MSNLCFVGTIGAIGLLAVIIFCGWGMLSLQSVKTEQELRDKLAYHGIRAAAEIVSQRTAGGRGSASHYVTYRYEVPTPDGSKTLLTREAEVSLGNYFALPVGTQIDTHYLPDDPKVSRFRGSLQEADSPSGLRASGYRAIAVGIGIGIFFALVTITVLQHLK